MSTLTPSQVATEPVPHKFTASEFLQMHELGIFPEVPRRELLDGEIYIMSPIGPLHSSVVNRLAELLILQLTGKAIVSVQNSVLLDNHSQPQPDIAILLPRKDYYASELPGPAQVLLAIEVAQSSLNYDRKKKLPLYAAAGVQEVWLIDLNQLQVEQFSEPSGEKYTQHKVVTLGEPITSTREPQVSFTIDRLFP